MPEIRVQDEQGTVHVFPDGSTPEMIAKAMNVQVAPQQATPDTSLLGKISGWLHNGQKFMPPRTAGFGDRSGEMPGTTEGPGLLKGLAEYDKASGGEIAGGIHDILTGNLARGAHRILGGAGAAASPALPFAAPAAVAAPLTTGISIGGGIAGQKLAQSGAQALGATPDQAALAGDIGGAVGGYAGAKLPQMATSAAKRTLLLGRTPEGAYESALKPSTTMNPQKRAQIIQTGLEQGIPVSKVGLEKLTDSLDNLNDAISNQIKAGAGAGVTANPYKVASKLSDTANKFATQVNPEADMNAISEAGNEFLRNNPNPIPADQAQAMKVGTYQQLRGKYGQLGNATIEAQKALARGIKEELATQIPELGNLNAQESKLINLEPVLERAVGRISNHQLVGIGTPIMAGGVKAITGSNKLAAVAGLMKAVLDDPMVKSRLAIAIARNGTGVASANARVLALANSLGQAATNQDQSQP